MHQKLSPWSSSSSAEALPSYWARLPHRSVFAASTVALLCGSIGTVLLLELTGNTTGPLLLQRRLFSTSNAPYTTGEPQAAEFRAHSQASQGKIGDEPSSLSEEQVHPVEVLETRSRPDDLPRLPADRSPNSDSWDNSIAICASMLKENVTDVREWLMYHRWLGVDHVYLAENVNGDSSEVSPEYTEWLQDLVDEGFLTLYSVPRPKGQMAVYSHCLARYYGSHSWLAFIDLDEYIHIRPPLSEEGEQEDGTAPLKRFLASRKQYAAVAVHWVMFGSSGLQQRPQGGGVLRHYSMCNPTANKAVKVIVNTWFALHTAEHPHNFVYRANMPAVDENGNALPWRQEAAATCDPTDTFTEGCRAAPHKYEEQHLTVDHIALFHYTIKSKVDFNIKLHRGNGFTRNWKFFDSINKYATETGGICSELQDVVDHCCAL